MINDFLCILVSLQKSNMAQLIAAAKDELQKQVSTNRADLPRVLTIKYYDHPPPPRLESHH